MTTTLNAHIVTSQAIDVWSVGCILAELFELFKEKTKRSSMPLFTNTMPHFAHHESKLIPSAAAEGPSAVTSLLFSPFQTRSARTRSCF